MPRRVGDGDLDPLVLTCLESRRRCPGRCLVPLAGGRTVATLSPETHLIEVVRTALSSKVPKTAEGGRFWFLRRHLRWWNSTSRAATPSCGCLCATTPMNRSDLFEYPRVETLMLASLTNLRVRDGRVALSHIAGYKGFIALVSIRSVEAPGAENRDALRGDHAPGHLKKNVSSCGCFSSTSGTARGAVQRQIAIHIQRLQEASKSIVIVSTVFEVPQIEPIDASSS